jgi:hypothetical protein
MPLTHKTQVFAITDARISRMLTDPEGGSATYGTSIDIPGVKTLTIGGAVEVKRLRGDNTLLAVESVITEVNCAIGFGKLSLDVLVEALGAVVTDAGTTPNQTATADVGAGAASNLFKVQGKSAKADPVGGDVWYTLWKCVLGDFPGMGLAEEDFNLHRRCWRTSSAASTRCRKHWTPWTPQRPVASCPRASPCSARPGGWCGPRCPTLTPAP